MNEGRVSFLLGEKGKDYHLLKKVVDILSALHGADFNLEDLLSRDFFSETEKQYLKNIFHQDISVIYAWEFSFYHQEGNWSYETSIYDHQDTVKKLLLLLNKREFSVASIVRTDDLFLIAALLREWNEMFAKDWKKLRDDDAPQFQVNQEVLEFISDNLKQRVGERSTFNFGFVKAFLEAFYDYQTMLLKKILEGKDS
jgi:hypothetical protein